MEKDFDKWNELKKQLNSNDKIIYANKREVWWCYYGLNVGTELYGKNDLFERPVLILKVFNKNTLKVVPLSTKIHKGKYYVEVPMGDDLSYASLTQVKTISTKRLSRKITRIGDSAFEKVLEAYKNSLS